MIYQSNRQDRKGLARQLAKYDRDTRRSRLDIQQQKNDLLRKWSLVFGRQRNFRESIKTFDEMLAKAIDMREQMAGQWEESESEEEEEELSEEEKARIAEEEKKKLLASIKDPRQRRASGRSRSRRKRKKN